MKTAVALAIPFKTAYGSRIRVQSDVSGVSMTKQSFKDECDINQIMRKYEKTALLTHVNRFQGNYGDYLDFQDYQTSLNQVLAAQEAFASLPSKIRSRFENDPAQFLHAVGDPNRREELTKLGIFNTPVEKKLPASQDNVSSGEAGGQA